MASWDVVVEDMSCPEVDSQKSQGNHLKAMGALESQSAARFGAMMRILEMRQAAE